MTSEYRVELPVKYHKYLNWIKLFTSCSNANAARLGICLETFLRMALAASLYHARKTSFRDATHTAGLNFDSFKN